MSRGGPRLHHIRASDLSGYLDSSLPARQSARARQHLEHCPTCLSELRSLRAAKSALASLPAAEPAHEWLLGVETRFRLDRRLAPKRSYRGRRSLHRRAACACLATGALGMGIWLSPPPAAPISFQDEVRQHLVQIDEPLSDQTSYVLQAGYP